MSFTGVSSIAIAVLSAGPEEGIVVNRLRKVKFARALVKGKTQKEAAIEAGFSPKSAHVMGSRLAKDPQVRAETARLMERRNLGVNRALKELDRGLKHGKLGSHDSYLEKQIRLLGADHSDISAVPNIHIVLQQLYQSAQERGLE